MVLVIRRTRWAVGLQADERAVKRGSDQPIRAKISSMGMQLHLA